MNCVNCGAPLLDTDRFCASCGTPVPERTPATWGGGGPALSPPGKTTASIDPTRPGSLADPAVHDHYRLMGAYSRSFTGSAVLTLVLYLFLWLPGLIANIVFLKEANKVEQLTGKAPEGKGCLLAMLVFFTLLLLGGCVFWAAVFGAMG
jgi:hypothetical protein